MTNRKGTLIVAENEEMERVAVSGAALKENMARITLKKVPDRPGVAARIFHTIAAASIVVDDIIQTETAGRLATVAFTVELADLPEAKAVCQRLRRLFRGMTVELEDDLAKVSAVGVGMRIHTGVAERMFAALASAGINIRNITTSEIRISCIIDRADGKRALRLVHDAFGLGGKGPGKPARKKK